MKKISTKALSLALTFAMILSIFSGVPLFGSVTAYADSSGVTAYCDGQNLYKDSGCTEPINKDDIIRKSITSVQFKDGTISISNSPFYSCTSLKSLTIPSTVTHIDILTFTNLINLSSIEVSSENSTFSAHDGVLYSGDTVFCCPQGKAGSVAVVNGTTEIGLEAFENCSSLTSISIPEAVTSLGYMAFSGCSRLTSFTIPKNVTDIGTFIFQKCSNLTELKVEDGNTAYGTSSGLLYSIDASHTLLECISGKSGEVMIPAEVSGFFPPAFDDCDKVTKISVADGNSAFSSENGILYNHDKTALLRCPQGMAGEITVAQSTQTVISGAFSMCPKLTGVTFSETLQSIDGGAFWDCHNVKSITISSATSVDDVINGIPGLYNLYILGDTIPDNLPCANNTFCFDKNQSGGYQLKSYTGNGVNRVIPTKLFGKDISPKITEGQLVTTNVTAYCDDNGLKKNESDTDYLYLNDPYRTTITKVQFADNIQEIPDSAFYNCSNLSEVDIPESVTAIDSLAFANCDSLKEITIPAKLTQLDDEIFVNCTSLSQIKVGEGNICFCVKDGILYSKDLTRLVCCSAQRVGSIKLPDTLTKIDAGAFFSCNGFTDITIPSGVTEIGEGSFYYCDALVAVRFQGKLNTIGDFSFAKQEDNSVTTFIVPVGTEDYYKDLLNSGVMQTTQAQIVTAKQITAFNVLPGNVRTQNISVGSQPTLPDSLTVTVSDGSKQTISGVTWTSSPVHQSNVTGTYVFTPTPPDAYEFDEAALPKITVNVASSTLTDKAITAFAIGANTGTINEANHTIAVAVPYGTNVTALTPTIAVSKNASVSPTSGTIQSFTNPVTYTVTAEDSSTQNYIVTVTVGANSSTPSNSDNSNHHSNSTSSTSPSAPSTTTTTTNSAGGTVATVTTAPTSSPVVIGNRSDISVTVPADVSSIITAATAGKPTQVKISIPAASIVDQINNSAVQTVSLTVQVPSAAANNTNASATVTINAEQAVLQAAKDAKKEVTITVVNSETGKEAYSWTFKGADLADSSATVKDVDLALSVQPTTAVPAVNAAAQSNKGLVLSFANNGILPSAATVKINVADQGYKPGQIVYFYYYNPTTKALEQVGNSAAYTVDANGFVSVTITHCSDYVLLPKQANSLMLDTMSYSMTPNKSYEIGEKLVGPKGTVLKAYSTNSKIATVTRLKNGNYQVFSVNPGIAYIMIDVYDNKNKRLTHASVRITVKTGIYPHGDSTRQIASF